MRALRLLLATLLCSSLACVVELGTSVGTAHAQDLPYSVAAYLTQTGPLVYACATVKEASTTVCVQLPTTTVPVPVPPDYVTALVTQESPILEVCFTVRELNFEKCASTG